MAYTHTNIQAVCPRPARPRSGQRPAAGRRSGYILVLLAILLPVLFIVAALVFELGFSMSTTRMMQSAADAAAVEGLRGRDATGNPVVDEPARRAAASTMVQNVFDDDLNTAADALALGAGPIIPFSDTGRTNANAGQTIDSTNFGNDAGRYNPVLQANAGNAPHGDMLSGTYNDALTHTESDLYVRPDFAPAGVPGTGNAFLVRLRRTRDAFGLDNQAGTSSSGPTLPYLLGRGSMMQAADPALGYSPRFHGMTVRATAIADGQRVMVMGSPIPGTSPGGPLNGAGFIMIDQAQWDGLAVGATVNNINWNAAGTLTRGPTSWGFSVRLWQLQGAIAAGDAALTVQSSGAGTPPVNFRIRIDDEHMLVTAQAGPGNRNWTITRAQDGTAAVAHANNTFVHLLQDVVVGDVVNSSVRPPNRRGLLFPQNPAWFAIYSIVNGTPYVVGYGQADLAAAGLNPNRFDLTKLAAIMAPRNASAVPSRQINVPPADIAGVFAQRLALDEPMLAPALARTYSR